jgi:hypothetical protein
MIQTYMVSIVNTLLIEGVLRNCNLEDESTGVKVES